MKKPVVLIGGLLALALLASAVWLLRPGETGGTVARITLDGELVREIDLSRQTTSETFVVTGKTGLTNTILVEPGRIRVEQADCPDQICVHQGFIDSGRTPIVCLPNKLMIELTGGGDDLDAVTG